MKAYRLSADAIADLDAIFAYIAEDNPIRAVSFIDEIVARFAIIAERPLSFPPRDDLTLGLRAGLHRPYLILFRVHEGTVEIGRIVHGARDIFRHLSASMFE